MRVFRVLPPIYVFPYTRSDLSDLSIYGLLLSCYLAIVSTHYLNPFRVVLGWAYRGLTGGFLLLQNFCVAISVSPHVCFILVLILISMFLR